MAQGRSTKIAIASPVSPQDIRTTTPVEKSNTKSESIHEALQNQPQLTSYTQNNNMSRSVQILDPGLPSFGVGIRVVEEPAPAGKARRWRWTPEHKLQPEPEPDRRCRVLGERVLGVPGSRHGVCAFTSSYSRSSSCSRIEESDILPFADRMKFFEETSKGVPGSNVSSLSSRRQKKSPEHQGMELDRHPNQRRYSYQGGLQQESSLLSNSMEARRQSVSTSRERQKERQREQVREREERAREREREERLRERERQQEKERQERELETERAKLREIQQEREREERVRQWERERERELELEREKEMERAREKEQLKKEREIELEREREMKREEDAQLALRQELYGNSGIKENHQDFHNFQPAPQTFSRSQTPNQGPRSAFHPVSATSQHPENQQPLHQGYTARSYTPTEVGPRPSLKTASLHSHASPKHVHKHMHIPFSLLAQDSLYL